MSFLIVDLGTSSARAATVDSTGRVTLAARRPMNIRTGPGGIAEIDPDEAWGLVIEVLRDFTAKNPASKPECLGLSSFLGYVLLGKDHSPLFPALTYQDTRARRETFDLSRRIKEAEVYPRTGRRLSPELLAPKILHCFRARPEAAKEIRWAAGLKDELVRRLTGHLVTDWAHMNYTYLFDARAFKPDPELCEAVGVSPEIFPEAGPAQRLAGSLTREAAALTGLREGLPVVAGSIDGTTAMYGSGLMLGDGFAMTAGTTDVFMLLAEKAPLDKERILNVNNGMAEKTFAVGGATGQAGGFVRYLLDLFKMDPEEAEKVLVAEGNEQEDSKLMVFPGLTGERSPYWNEKARAGILGIGQNTSAESVVKAAMEACAYRLACLREVFKRSGLASGRVYLAGGASFPAWNQLRADVLGLPVHENEEREATVLGTAMFCRSCLEGRSLEVPAREWIKTLRVYEPVPERTEKYRIKRRRFEELYRAAAAEGGEENHG